MLVKLIDPLLHIIRLLICDALGLRIDIPILFVKVGAVHTARNNTDWEIWCASEWSSRAIYRADGGVTPGIKLAVGVHEALGVLHRPTTCVFIHLRNCFALLNPITTFWEEQLALIFPVLDIDEAGNNRWAVSRGPVLPVHKALGCQLLLRLLEDRSGTRLTVHCIKANSIDGLPSFRESSPYRRNLKSWSWQNNLCCICPSNHRMGPLHSLKTTCR